MISNVNLS